MTENHVLWGDIEAARVDEPDFSTDINGNRGTLIGIFKGLLYHSLNQQEFQDDALEKLEIIAASHDKQQGVGLQIYSATFAAVAVTAAQDAFFILAPSDKRVILRYASLSQYSDFGDAAAEILGITVIRGFTAAGSGGAAVTPARRDTTVPAPGSTVRRNDTTVATAGTTQTLVAETMNIAAGWIWNRPPSEWFVVEPGQGIAVRIVAAPADELTMQGTVIFEEIPV